MATNSAARHRPSYTPAPHTVPKALRLALYIPVLLLGFLGMLNLGRQGSGIPATIVLDVWIILFMLICLFRGRIQTTLLLLVLTAYLLTRIVPALTASAPMEDFLQAYRWILYLAAFALALGKSWGPVDGLIRFTWILAVMATAKAGLTLVTIGPGERPGLLIENNFELALFCGLTIALYSRQGRYRSWLVLLLGLLTILSGSRSGAVIFSILFIFAIIQARKLNLLSRYILTLSTLVAVFVPIYIFSSRQGPGRTDRERFLDVFIDETQNWDILTWLIGTTPITPLSAGACSRLSFYESLFSSVGDGSCYSVILHSFLMRVIFDAGIVGLLISILVPWAIMRRAGVKTMTALALTGVAIANAASVSGLNNPYVALPILLAILTASRLSRDASSLVPHSERNVLNQRSTIRSS